MKPSLFERAYAALAPERAARSAIAAGRLMASREMAAALASVGGSSALSDGYSSASPGNAAFNRRWTTTPRSAGADLLPQVRTLRGQARDLVRNEPVASSWINTKVSRAVGTGLALSAQPHRATLGWSEEQARDWKLKVQSEFSLWADSTECDWYGVGTFYDLQDLVLRGMLESGDTFTVLPDGERTPTMPYALRLQVLEADRVGNPNNEADTELVAGGVRMRRSGGIDGYHVYDRHPGSQVIGAAGFFTGQWYAPVGPSGRRRILHHFKQLRPELTRGVPDLAPVAQLFKDLNTYKDAEIKAAIVSAFLTLVIQTPAGTGPAPVFSGAVTEHPGESHDEIAMGPGSVIGLNAGETANVVNPGRPNPQFAAFVDAILHQLGAASFLGSEMLMKRYSTSYVAARASFLDAWKHLLDLRTRVVRTLCQPVYETLLAEAVAIGRVAAPGFFADPLIRWAYTRATWNGDSQGSINPKDEVAAYTAAVDARLMSRERAEWELFGTDFSETYDTKKAEHDRLKADDMLPVPKAGAAAPQAQPEPAA